MNNDNLNQNPDTDQDPEMEQCAPGCVCKKVAPKKRIGIIICLVIVIAALFYSMYICGNKNHLTPTAQTSHTDVKH